MDTQHALLKPSALFRPSQIKIGLLVVSLFFTLHASALFAAGESILVLDYEVNDLTMNPATEAEKERAITLGPLMQTALKDAHGYQIVELEADVQESADKGFGYLYDKPAVVAELGESVDADYVIVGRVHKASFLFVYFKALVIDVRQAKLVSEQIIEVKGPQRKFSAKGIEALSILVDRDIQQLIKGS